MEEEEERVTDSGSATEDGPKPGEEVGGGKDAKKMSPARMRLMMASVCVGEMMGRRMTTYPSQDIMYDAFIHYKHYPRHPPFLKAFAVVGITFSIPPAFYPSEAEDRGITASQVGTLVLISLFFFANYR